QRLRQKVFSRLCSMRENSVCFLLVLSGKELLRVSQSPFGFRYRSPKQYSHSHSQRTGVSRPAFPACRTDALPPGCRREVQAYSDRKVQQMNRPKVIHTDTRLRARQRRYKALREVAVGSVSFGGESRGRRDC